MILIGTSGFHYADWVGAFYPPALPKDEWLAYYSQHFRACELNFSYYRVPTAQTFVKMLDHTGGRMNFVVKAHQEMTHQRAADNAAVFAAFIEALQPLIDADALGCVLAQFPFSFHATREHCDYLERFRERMGAIPLVIEFRNHRWVREATFSLLKRLNCGFCCVDEPRLEGLMPPLAVATSDIGYVRFHGRNQEAWWQPDTPEERYRYRYAEAELAEWMPKIRALSQKTTRVYLFMNNHPQGHAVENAKQLERLLASSFMVS